MTTRQKHPHSFSANFFGVTGYVGTVMVWLLVITSGVLLLPAPVSDEVYRIAVSDSTGGAGAVSQGDPAVLRFLLGIMLVVMAWVFAYIMSRLLSRVVKRIARILLGKKLTVENFFKTKYSIHAIGLVLLLVLALVSPVYLWTKTAITLLAIISGLVGMIAIAAQRQLTKRHKLALDDIL